MLELKGLLANLGLIAPDASLYTLADVYTAVEGFHYNASSNFATLQADILTAIGARIVENSPFIDGGDTAAFTIDENATDVATIVAIDAQGDNLTYTLSGADAFLFKIDDDGNLSFIDAPDFEAPADTRGDNVYDVTVTVSDGAQTVSQDIAVTVADVDEATDSPASPPFTEGANFFAVPPSNIALLPTVQIAGEDWYQANMGGGDDRIWLFAGADERFIVSGGAGADTFVFGLQNGGFLTDRASMVITDFDTAEDFLELAWLGVGLTWSDASGDLVGTNTRGSTVTLEGLDMSDLPDIDLLITDYFAPEF